MSYYPATHKTKTGGKTVLEEYVTARQTAIGTDFVAALATHDLARLQACFQAEVKFRALVPGDLREGLGPEEATGWLLKWFGDADEVTVLTSSVEWMADRLHVAYRLHVRTKLDWDLIEQQAFCTVDNGLISVMNLVCSGFRPDTEGQRK